MSAKHWVEPILVITVGFKEGQKKGEAFKDDFSATAQQKDGFRLIKYLESVLGTS